MAQVYHEMKKFARRTLPLLWGNDEKMAICTHTMELVGALPLINRPSPNWIMCIEESPVVSA